MDVLGFLIYIYVAQLMLLILGSWKGREQDISSSQFADIFKSNRVVTVGEYSGLMVIYIIVVLFGYNLSVFYHALG